MFKKVFCIPLLALLLAVPLGGCTGEGEDNALALQLRADFMDRQGCAGTMEVKADYGQRVYEYTVTFSGTEEEGLSLVITAPEEAAGITATVAQGQTFLTFDGVHLDALPAFLTAMESGYIAETNSELLGETETLRLCFRDPARSPGEGLETILWFDKAEKTLLQGELRSDGTTVIRCVFSDFIITRAAAEETT